MAVNNLGRTWQSNVTVSISGDPPRPVQSYTQIWMVQLDDPCTEELDVGTAPGLPAVGDISGTFFCESRNFVEDQNNPGLYTVTISWTTDRSKYQSTGSGSGGGDGGGSGDGPDYQPDDPSGLPDRTEDEVVIPDTPPWERMGKWRVVTNYLKTPVTNTIYTGVDEVGRIGDGQSQKWNWLTDAGQYWTFTRNGKTYYVSPLTNSAGTKVIQEHEFPQLTYYCSFAMQWDQLNAAIHLPMLGHINDTAMEMPITGRPLDPGTLPGRQIYPIGSVKYTNVSVTEAYFQPEDDTVDGAGSYAQVEMEFQTNLLPGGFRRNFIDEGTHYYDGGRGPATDPNAFKTYLDAEGNPVSAPLNGQGDIAGVAGSGIATVWHSPQYFNDLRPAVLSPYKVF